jgi:hypothetical protein
MEALKETVQDRKNDACWWKKRLGIGNAQMWNERRRRQRQTTPEQQILPKKSCIGSQGVYQSRRTTTINESTPTWYTFLSIFIRSQCLYMFRVLLAHLQEAVHRCYLV